MKYGDGRKHDICHPHIFICACLSCQADKDAPSKFVSTGTCPIIKGEFSLCKKFGLFKGNQDVDMKFDFSNFFGFNLCSIIKAIVLGFTSVVVFILSFRVISKSGM